VLLAAAPSAGRGQRGKYTERREEAAPSWRRKNSTRGGFYVVFFLAAWLVCVACECESCTCVG
jgi:hypothetical protein